MIIMETTVSVVVCTNPYIRSRQIDGLTGNSVHSYATEIHVNNDDCHFWY